MKWCSKQSLKYSIESLKKVFKTESVHEIKLYNEIFFKYEIELRQFIYKCSTQKLVSHIPRK